MSLLAKVQLSLQLNLMVVYIIMDALTYSYLSCLLHYQVQKSLSERYGIIVFICYSLYKQQHIIINLLYLHVFKGRVPFR